MNIWGEEWVSCGPPDPDDGRERWRHPRINGLWLFRYPRGHYMARNNLGGSNHLPSGDWEGPTPEACLEQLWGGGPLNVFGQVFVPYLGVDHAEGAAVEYKVPPGTKLPGYLLRLFRLPGGTWSGDLGPGYCFTPWEAFCRQVHEVRRELAEAISDDLTELSRNRPEVDQRRVDGLLSGLLNVVRFRHSMRGIIHHPDW